MKVVGRSLLNPITLEPCLYGSLLIETECLESLDHLKLLLSELILLIVLLNILLLGLPLILRVCLRSVGGRPFSFLIGLLSCLVR